MHRIYIVCLILLTALFSCNRNLIEQENPDMMERLPEGVPTTLYIPFVSTEALEVDVTTKAESSAVDETSIHDLYVMIFNNGDTSPGSARKIYGRFFSYDHLKTSLALLDADDHECWYVSNKTLDNSVSATTGAVKISTITCSDATLVVIANVTTSIVNMDGIDPLDRLKTIEQYDELKNIQVRLEQHVVNRKDLFLMTGEMDVDTRLMTWGTLPKNYNSTYKLSLTPIDAKVKFRVKVNPTNISAVTPVYWQVCNTPDRCYMYTDDVNPGRNTPEDINYFESQQYYFEGKEEVAGETWYTFCFYMLENNQNPNGNATSYFQRELREKIDSGEEGYKGPTGPESESFSDHFVNNGDWRYAPTFGTYVRFDLVLTLTTAGIAQIGEDDPDISIGHALTSDAIFTVHLGEFNNSDATGSPLNDYVTKRGHSYTYNITINNTKSIYTEVRSDDEVQAGQEGFLLLTDSEIINADCHYEYHQVEFEYRPDMKQEKFSWYVKTPFGEGGPVIHKNESTGEYTYDATGLDYLWVKFGINKKVPADYLESNPSSPNYPDPPTWLDRESGNYVCPYSTKRHKYPGDSPENRHYDPTWKPGQAVAPGVISEDPNVPDLMDITQLILYVFSETTKYTNHEASAFIADDDGVSTVPVIRATAFIDEYYYETDPLNPSAGVDPELWRKFVNANPRELHILSNAQQSRDKKSDVILSSHSIIQQSIQTIYNIYSADLRSLWGTEHQDEMRNKTNGWPYWPNESDPNKGRAGKFEENDINSATNGKENGRLNTAYIWDLYSSQVAGGNDKTNRTWNTYVNYEVNNNTPELLEAYHGMAWSCLTRNRDNNGNGIIDRNEVRWYLAAANQLAGMWIGNESLSINARLYQPAENQWRAHVISSSGRRVSWTEEGGGATKYSSEFGASAETWPTQAEASLGESVRCLRNIGTYDDGGVVRDMTEAPYDQEPQHYFTITEVYDSDHPDDKAYMRYVFHFDRLNPKSLRELSEGELPYHDQFNVNNCVYLKMETQSRKDEEDIEPATLNVDTDDNGVNETYKINDNHTYSVTFEKINPIVTKLGYNPFCPPGYRFPNHSEMLLMSLYLPNDEYHRSKPDGSSYGLTVYTPCRTYYDRGLYGKNTTGFEYDYRGESAVTTAEQKKVGWGWSDKLHCAQKTDKLTVSRCVRDVSMTGTIEGGILMRDELYPGDSAPLSFSFYSSGASFISASLKLCFTDGDGVYHERDIPVQTAPTGLQFLADQTVTIPTLSSLGLTDEILDANEGALRHKTKFKITLRNAYTSKTFEQPFTLGNPLTGSIDVEGAKTIYPGDTKKVLFDVGSMANSTTLASYKLDLIYTDHAGATQTVSLSPVVSLAANNSQTFTGNTTRTVPALSALNAISTFGNADLGQTATIRATITDAGGSEALLYVPVGLNNPLYGSINIDGNGAKVVYPGDTESVTFDLHTYSSSATLSTVGLELIYKDSNGTVRSEDITSLASIASVDPTSKSYTGAQDLVMPALGALTDFGNAQLGQPEDNPVSLRVTFADVGGCEKTFDLPVGFNNPLGGTFTVDGNHKLIPGNNKNMDFSITSLATSCYLATATLTLKYQNSSDIDTQNTLTIPGVTASSLTYENLDQPVAIPATGGGVGQLALQDSNLPRTATLELTVTDNGGSSKIYSIEYVNSKHLQIGEDPSFTGFRIKATAANTTVTFDANYADNIQYSLDGGETWRAGTTPGTLVNVGDQMYVRGDRTNYKNDAGVDDYGTPADHPLFKTSGNKKVYIAGNIMSLLNDSGSLVESAFQGTFSRGKTGSTENSITYIDISDTDPLYLPVTNLADKCYMQMFRKCTSLTHAPTFTVNSAAYRCCYNMFRGCSNLSDVSTISLPANQMYEDCYREMFRLCSSLTTVDSGLLPATNLARYCYTQMFNESGITRAPDLPATTLTTECYRGMFLKCYSLTYVKCLAQTGISGNTIQWVKDTNGSGTFVKYTGVSWTTGENGIPSGWTVSEWSPTP